MRYGLELKNAADVFPQDVTFGIELQDVPAVVIPPRVAVGCTPSMPHWQVLYIGQLNFGETADCFTRGGYGAYPAEFGHVDPTDSGVFAGATGATLTVSIAFGSSLGGAPDARKPAWWICVPIVERCGHRIRFVTTGESATWFSNVDSSDPYPGVNSDLIFLRSNFGVLFPPHQTITIKCQIDLTDAAPGSETWTDIGPILAMQNF